MIQFKKIPPSKSVLLLLLFLTANSYGFLQDNQNEYQVTRKTQNLYSMDLQQPVTQNMPIRRTGIDRVINEKDGNERLYDLRSFRTGTIERNDNIQNRERSIQRSRVNERTDARDLNNNRQSFAAFLQGKIQNNRRALESVPRENRQRLVEDRRSGERAVISRNRQYDERPLEARTERDVDRAFDRSSGIHDRRTLRVRELNQRINERRTVDVERNAREETMKDRRDIQNRRLYHRRTTDRELPERQLNNRRIEERRSDRLAENRLSPDSSRSVEIRRTIRSVDVRDRRASDERNLSQRRSFTQRLERMDSRENTLESRFVESRDRRISETRNVKDRRSSEERNDNTERLQRLSSKGNTLERRSVENRDRRISEIRNVDQRRSSDSERSQRSNSRENSLESRFVENRDRRSFEVRRVDQRRSSERRNVDTERLQRLNFRENPLQRLAARNQDRRISTRLSTEERRSLSAQRLDRTSSISENRNADQNRRSSLQSDRIDSGERNALERRHTEDQSRRETREISRRSSRDRQFSTEPAERRDQRLSERRNYFPDTRRTTDRLQSTTSRDATTRERDIDERRAVDSRRTRERENRSIDNRQQSRSDSTRYIQDNTHSGNIRSAFTKASTRDSRGDVNENSRRENVRITDRYNSLTTNSQRATRNTVRNAELPTLSMERNIDNNDAYSWVNTAKVILAAFLIGQIFVNSSKANKFR